MNEDVKTVEYTITPEIAKLWLQPHPNRKLDKSHVKFLAEEMKYGWEFNGETIKFSKDKLLIDGQHRLAACILSSCSFRTLVTFGVDPNTIYTINVGKKRSIADGVHVQAQKSGNDVLAKHSPIFGRMLTLIWKLKNGALGQARFPNVRQRMQLTEQLPDLTDSLVFGVNHQKIVSAGTSGFLHYYGTLVDEKTVDFLEALDSGVVADPNSPIYVCREYLIARVKSRRKLNHKRDEHTAVCIKAMNAWLRGKEIKTLKFADNESFPVLSKTVDNEDVINLEDLLSGKIAV